VVSGEWQENGKGETMSDKLMRRREGSGFGARGVKARALARAVWAAAKARDLLYEDVIGCCALLVDSVATNSGEPVEYLLTEIKRRLKPKA
jgi:hypothetical protein